MSTATQPTKGDVYGPKFPKAPLWVQEGCSYLLRHLAFGEFRGCCTQASSHWGVFRILDDSPQLIEHGYSVGQEIELSATFTRAQII